jgi:hypothetical protein
VLQGHSSKLQLEKEMGSILAPLLPSHECFTRPNFGSHSATWTAWGPTTYKFLHQHEINHFAIRQFDVIVQPTNHDLFRLGLDLELVVT